MKLIYGTTNKAEAIIQPLAVENLPEYADVIRRSFATVAQDFDWTKENAPGYVSFRTDEQLAKKEKDGYLPFGLFICEKIIGFVSLTDMGNGSYELNKLAVLPEHRHYGYGKRLIDFCKEKVKNLGGSKITLDLIEENSVLKNWYAANGFVHTGTKKFEYLPFTTGYMEWEAKK
ncbi:MAG: GNAT family N-acetyltransferase [Oscillospiraceae bacterium]|nr:GNAT family N-acetyltransferase [Oscillospiraceae bacterium]